MSVDSNRWTIFVWLLIDHRLTDTNRDQLSYFIDWYRLIDWFSDHRFHRLDTPRLHHDTRPKPLLQSRLDSGFSLHFIILQITVGFAKNLQKLGVIGLTINEIAMHVPKTFTASASFPASAPTSRFWAWFWTKIPSSPVFMSWRWTSVSPRGRILKISCHFPLTLSSKKTWQTHEKLQERRMETNGNEVFVFVVSSALPVIFRDTIHVAHFQVALKSCKHLFDVVCLWR